MQYIVYRFSYLDKIKKTAISYFNKDDDKYLQIATTIK